MKKIVYMCFLMAGTLAGKAQDLNIVKAYIIGNDLVRGKEGIDKFLAKPGNENNAEALYYKAFLYTALSRDASKGEVQQASFNAESFEALKKSYQVEPKNKAAKEDENGTVYNIYYAYYDFGVKAYNAKNYEGSYNQFKSTLDVHDYIFSNKIEGPKGLKFAALDTDVVWNLALLGSELKKENETFGYYKKIVDAGLTEARYLQAYETVVLHYKETKDPASFDQYLAKGKAVYPKEQFWEAADIENSVQDLTGDALFKKYDELTLKYPDNYAVFFNYAIEMNRYVYADENKNADLTAYKNRIPELFKKAIAINSTTDANFTLASYYYNNYFDLNEAAGKIKGTKPDDVKKRTELLNAAKKSMDDCQPFALAAIGLFEKMTKLKQTEKNSWKQAYEMLEQVAKVKGDAAKAAEYKAKKEAIQ